MAIGQGIFKSTAVTYQQQQQDAARVKKGLRILREAMKQDIKQKSSRPSGLPKDWRNRVIQ